MKINKQIHYPVIVLLAAFLYAACSTVTNAPLSRNLVSVYNKHNAPMFPEFTVFHYAKDSSRLYFLLKTNELNVNNDKEKPTVSYRLQYAIYRSFEHNELIDSATLSFYNEDVSARPYFINHFINIKTENIRQAVLYVKMRDISGPGVAEDFIFIDREDLQNRHYYLAAANGLAVNGNVHEARYVDISKTGKATLPYAVRFYQRDFGVAMPPYYFDKQPPFSYKADSAFVLPQGQSLNITGQGFYHIQADTATRSGLTLFKFYDGFPNVLSANNLLEPLRYITAEKEYEELLRKPNHKTAVDAFWLNIGNDEIRTRELIRKFYGRVVYANRLFTSFKEGWKTDRGMIYIVFGTPNVVYKTDNTESWVYGEENHLLSLTFNFVKVTNPFTDNDFELNRSPIYQNQWFSAIDHWRDGRPNNEY